MSRGSTKSDEFQGSQFVAAAERHGVKKADAERWWRRMVDASTGTGHTKANALRQKLTVDALSQIAAGSKFRGMKPDEWTSLKQIVAALPAQQ